MIDESHIWLPIKEAARLFGYTHPESLRHRLRELRRRGKVLDIGTPPTEYQAGKGEAKDKIILYWPNPGTALIRSDAPNRLLNPRRGKRSRFFRQKID